MKANSIYLVFALLLLFVACGESKKETSESEQTASDTLEIKDGMVYGLACEGCNDTFVVMIPTANLEGRPIKLNVSRAMKLRKVIGKLEPGDWCAAKLNAKDPTVADIVINMDLLKGKWVHQVLPEEKENARAMILLEDPDADVDSIIGSYMIPVERGFQLMRKGKAASIGMQNLASAATENIPVVYPSGTVYDSWKVVDGQIILSEADSIQNPENIAQMIPNKNIVRDTCDFLMLLKDSLQISYKGYILNYYRAK